MQCAIITLFPDMFSALECGITGRALQNGLLTLSVYNPRDYTSDKHQTVDDKPYGGGPGMLMMADPLLKAVQAAKAAMPDPDQCKVIYLSPQGKRFTQAAAKSASELRSVIFIAGRYEGIDERVIDQVVDEEWSIGDFILSGGELAAMVVIDAMSRHIPGVVGDDQSVASDSLSNGLLKYPQFTRPEELNGATIPKVLISGHHQQIEMWRKKQSLGRTWQKRPDLLSKISLPEEEKTLLDEFIQENKA